MMKLAYLLTLTFQMTAIVESVTFSFAWEKIMGRKKIAQIKISRVLATEAFPNDKRLFQTQRKTSISILH